MNKPRRDTRAEINIDSLLHNLQEVRKKTGTAKIMGEVKANAYGHGMFAVSRALESAGIDYFGVALMEEALSLRQNGIKKPILVQACIDPAQAPEAVKHNLTVSLSEPAAAKALSAAAKKLKKRALVHIKVDTGLHRFGRLPEDIPELVRQTSRLEGICMEGIYSHFASSLLADKSYTMMQFNSFLKVIAALEKIGYTFPLRHIAGSLAIIEFPGSYLDMVRTGTALYGTKRVEGFEFTPVLSLKSRVCFVKSVPAGSLISYRMKYRTEKRSNIAVISIGYADGLPRALYKKGEVLIRGKRFPIAGIVAMDNTMIDVGDADISAGEEVVVIGRQGSEEITVAQLAEKLETSNGEITSRISERVPRVYTGKR